MKRKILTHAKILREWFNFDAGFCIGLFICKDWQTEQMENGRSFCRKRELYQKNGETQVVARESSEKDKENLQYIRVLVLIPMYEPFVNL